jgi:LPXTG-site transpeptidase (sortase) family protein
MEGLIPVAAALPIRSAGKRRSTRITGRSALIAVLIGAAVAGGCGRQQPVHRYLPSASPVVSGTAGAGTLPRAEPVRIDIPAIDVHAPVGRVGMTVHGTMDVPPLDRPGETGWFIYGPTPGELGPAVIVGHVDSTRGPAVFFRLHQLQPGDIIYVARADGTTAAFRTTSVEQVPKADFPTERVYGNLDYPALRLVTCGGTFIRGRGSYLDNIIAFAALVGSRP